MMRNYLILSASVIILSGCSGAMTSDLQTWVQNSGKEFVGKVEPLPPMKTFTPVPYAGASLGDPFALQKSNEETSSVNAPDPNRKKEFLESFPLEQMRMVGFIEKRKKPYALVKTPDGATNIVSEGNFMGSNYGKIESITPDMVKLIEKVQDSRGTWTERPMEMPLSEK